MVWKNVCKFCDDFEEDMSANWNTALDNATVSGKIANDTSYDIKKKISWCVCKSCLSHGKSLAKCNK
ncbi:MAG: hypothetical protein V1870_03285 [Candidatus Aenigmatarchaeota archaeon]